MIENNLYAEFSSVRDQTKVDDLASRAAGYGMPGVVVDGNDPDAVLPVVADAVRRARAGEGPTLIEAKTYRLRGHYDGDPQAYRTKEEVADWVTRDPVPAYRSRLLEDGRASDGELAAIEQEVRDEITAAMRSALDVRFPTAEELLSDVYAGEPTR